MATGTVKESEEKRKREETLTEVRRELREAMARYARAELACCGAVRGTSRCWTGGCPGLRRPDAAAAGREAAGGDGAESARGWRSVASVRTSTLPVSLP